MAVGKDKIYSYIDSFIENKVLAPDSQIGECLVKNKVVTLSGVPFELNCWEEVSDSGRIVCVELRKKKLAIFSEVYSLGVLFSDGVRKRLSQEDLWDLGF